MDKNTAKRLMEIFDRIGNDLNLATPLIQDIDDTKEREDFLSSIAEFMADIWIKFMGPIVKQYPEFDPDKGTKLSKSLEKKIAQKQSSSVAVQSSKTDLKTNYEGQHIFLGLLKALKDAETIQSILKQKDCIKILSGPDYGFSKVQAESLKDLRRPISELDEQKLLDGLNNLKKIESKLKNETR